MAVTIAEFRARFWEFESTTAYPDARIDAKLQEAVRSVNVDHFEGRADDATYYLAAHLLVLSSPARGGGAQSVSAGSASVTYAAANPTDKNSLALTSYGQRYRELVRLGGGARLVW